ncbi:hypothetical protein [Enterococcus sp.]|uniref:hypothetical protein n=1 Tax=Enterococcus sp. TaxID=35783 RepID=UPI002FCC74F1
MGKVAFNQLFENLETYVNPALKTTVLVLSYGQNKARCQVKEFYGRTFEKSWEQLFAFYRSLPSNIAYYRIDLITEEQTLSFEELLESIDEVKRNNYIPFGIRVEGFKKRLFLKEELVANAILIPSKEHIVGKNRPQLQFSEKNFKNYIKRKYNIEEYTMNYLLKSTIHTFKTQAFFIENDTTYELLSDDIGNQVRVIEETNFQENLDLVIERGANYLLDQLDETGKFIYGYFPCYDSQINNYNSIRHFSSLYALFEAAEFLADKKMIQSGLEGLLWGFEHLSEVNQGEFLIKDFDKGVIEYKLGAQAMAILAAAKYTQITGDTQFFENMKTLTHTIEKIFLTKENETIHVFDENLKIKEQFRIIYYDGEALFSMLRAYELMKDEEIFAICKRLMSHFVKHNYEKYNDHWLSYAVNEFLKHEEQDEYYQFGLKNALNRLNFIEKRDTAYPTMLELLTAATKMILKLEVYDNRQKVISDADFQDAKNRIFEVMEHRAHHEMVTGVMFPEFSMYFKAPYKIEYGFFARHDRFRMRIDDAEHFLSGFVNFRMLMNGSE